VGKYNIVKDYDWTTIPRGASLRSKAPKVLVRSYKVKSNLLLNRLKSYIQVASSQDSKQFYESLYSDATEPEDDFYFPYFENSARRISNSWGDTFQNGYGGTSVGAGIDAIARNYIGTLAEIKTLAPNEGAFNEALAIASSKNFGIGEKLKGVSSALSQGSSPGSYIESPKFYDYASAQEGALRVMLTLSNTINSDFDKNYQLIKKLIEINKPKRNDAISIDPPRIYRVKLYGYRYMPWAYVNSLDIEMLGTKRMINNIIIPEAYNISIEFQPLTIEVSNFLTEG
jgi:hypothetical protein